MLYQRTWSDPLWFVSMSISTLFPINRTSIEEDIREKIEKLKHFCKIVFHSEVNYHLKPIKSLVKSIIKKIKLKIGKDALNYILTVVE